MEQIDNPHYRNVTNKIGPYSAEEGVEPPAPTWGIV